MSGEAPAAGAAAAAPGKDQAAPPTKSRRGIECTPLEKQVLEDIIEEFNHKKHIKFPKYRDDKDFVYWADTDLDAYADTLSCSVEELRATHKKMKRAFFKLRAADVDQQRTLKRDVFQACVLWNLKTVDDVHRRLDVLAKQSRSLERERKSIIDRGEHHAMIAERLAMWEAERHCRFQSELEAAIEPTIKERNKEQQTILDSKIAYHEKQAEWAQAAVARYEKKTADFAAAHPTKDEQIRKQQRKIDDQDRELRTLRKQVQGHKAQQQQQQKRKRNREEERQRRLGFSTHPAVSTCTPESTSKRLSVRKSRTSALARIDNALATNNV